MLNERELTLIRVALISRLDSLQEARPEVYDECKLLLHKLWQMRLDARALAREPHVEPPINPQSPIST